ncbi:Arsb [Symbiodinium sp. KB8]|nr:Arsb [Symbiodinium sp. KB8]
MATAAKDEVDVDVETDEQKFLLTLESRVFVKNRAYFLFMTAREKMAELWRKSGRALGLRVPSDLDLEALGPPQTEPVVRAFELCREFSGESLFNHCMRAYYFAAAVRWFGEGSLDGLDLEQMAVAFAFHDFGLTRTSQTESEESMYPFEVRGARRCLRFALKETQMTQQQIKVMYEAIRLHTALGFEKPTELAGLITVGTCCDVVGYRCEDVSKKTKADILKAYPRLKWKDVVIKAFADDAKMPHPSPVMRRYQREYFFNLLVRMAPFSE